MLGEEGVRGETAVSEKNRPGCRCAQNDLGKSSRTGLVAE